MTDAEKIAHLESILKTKPNTRLRNAFYEIKKREVLAALRARPAIPEASPAAIACRLREGLNFITKHVGGHHG